MSLTLVATGLVVFLSHGLEAVTGFGCTVLALPFVTLLLGIDRAKFILAILAWVLAVYIAASKWRRIVWKQYAIILLFVGAGMPIGMYAFTTLPRALLVKLLGVFIVLSSSIQLRRLFFPRPSIEGDKRAKAIGRLYYVLLFLGGIVHGAFASGGPLVVLYASRALPDKGNFRATLTLLWATLNTALIVSFASSGQFTGEAWGLLAWMAPFLVAGIVAGELVHNRVDGSLFSRIVFSTLFATGWIMLAV